MRVLACVAAAAALGLVGCAQFVWVKPGATEAEFNQDMGGCRMYALSLPQYQARQLPPTYQANTTYNGNYTPLGGGSGSINANSNTVVTPMQNSNQGIENLNATIANIGQQEQALNACMQSRGYYQQKAPR